MMSEPEEDVDAVFAITGMTCASCAAVIEKTLAKQPGVHDASVNLASERLSVRFDAREIDAAAIVKAVESAGYGAVEMAVAGTSAPGGHVTFAITGMTCASCSAVVEKTLSRMPGIAKASVNLATETASVDFDPAVVSVDDIITAVKKAGYGAIPKFEHIEKKAAPGEDAQRLAQQAHTARQRTLFIFSLLLAVPAFLVSMVPPFMTVIPMKV
ncbi:MAG: copper ion binding protein, partial [Coriobacteriia bacterium]